MGLGWAIMMGNRVDKHIGLEWTIMWDMDKAIILSRGCKSKLGHGWAIK